MRPFDVFSGAGRAATAAAHARVADLTMALPIDAQVSVAINKEPQATTYSVLLLGSRRGFPALAACTSPVIRDLGTYEELDLRIAETAESGAAFSSILVGGVSRDQRVLDSLVRGHDSLLALLADQSLLVDGLSGGYTVTRVAHESAVHVAGVLAGWWGGMLASEPELWPVSGISVEIGGTSDDPGISYAVDLEGTDDASGTRPVPPDEHQQYARRAIAAWTENLGDLGVMSKVRLRRGYGVRLGFTATELKPRVVAEDLESGDEAEEEASEIAAAIRFHNPRSTIQP